MSGQFGAAGGIKSIQRGTLAVTTGGTGTVTISAVDPAKSVLISSQASGTAGHSTLGTVQSVMAGLSLTNSTTITWSGGSAIYTSLDTAGSVKWQLVEYQ